MELTQEPWIFAWKELAAARELYKKQVPAPIIAKIIKYMTIFGTEETWYDILYINNIK